MERLIIEGGYPLQGENRVSGAKNAALPLLASTLLTDRTVTFSNVPHLHDVTTIVDLLSQIGSSITVNERMCIEVQNREIRRPAATHKLVKTMRASILVLGPLLARCGRANVSLPGGCAIGERPVDMHLVGLKEMGADIQIENDSIRACAKRLHGTRMKMRTVTVTGTENLMMAATLAKGSTLIENAAREPEVKNLACFLKRMGAQIEGDGTDRIEIEGVETLDGGHHDILPDRIEAGTYLIAAAMTSGRLRLRDIQPELLSAVLDKLEEAGADIIREENAIEVNMLGRRPRAINLSTAPFPGIPTDMQAQFTAMNCIAEGNGKIAEGVFENRFLHVQELRRMGAKLRQAGNSVNTRGVSRLHGAHVRATDLRASASLVLAGLVAEGTTYIDEIYHIDRGYETLEEKFSRIGANIRRVPAPEENTARQIDPATVS